MQADPSSANALMIALVAAGGVVFGAVVAAAGAFGVQQAAAMERRAIDKTERARQAAERLAKVNFEKGLIVRLLETYARSCADTVWNNGDDEEEGAMSPPDFPKWPKDLDWSLIGVSEMMKARDIEVRVAIRKSSVQGDFHYNASSEHEARAIFGDGAARIGWEAWTIAQEMRDEIGIDPFIYPDVGGNHRDCLRDRVKLLDERARLYRARNPSDDV